jgi:hypothetical protein
MGRSRVELMARSASTRMMVRARMMQGLSSIKCLTYTHSLHPQEHLGSSLRSPGTDAGKPHRRDSSDITRDTPH